jgi:CRP-like cAMP-binding protein
MDDLMASNVILGNVLYLLQLSSLLMTEMKWLRGIAILAGAGKIIYRYFVVYDLVSVFWEFLFLLVNITQLLIILWENRTPIFSSEEQFFLDVVAPGLLIADSRGLVGAGTLVDLPPGAKISTEGVRLEALTFILTGKVAIERAGKRIGQCGAGDFLGEMTYASRKPATATATVLEEARCLRFERSKLEAVERARPMVRLALHASFNRNLIDKLDSASGSSRAGVAAQLTQSEQG